MEKRSPRLHLLLIEPQGSGHNHESSILFKFVLLWFRFER
jgi:hypothetical protein